MDLAPILEVDFTPLLHAVLLPRNVGELSTFYLTWTVLYMSVNIVWDIKSPHTPAFHISDMRSKVPTAWSASSMCSSLLLVLSIFSQSVRQLAQDTLVPVLLAGISGILLGIGELCPYDIRKLREAQIGPRQPRRAGKTSPNNTPTGGEGPR